MKRYRCHVLLLAGGNGERLWPLSSERGSKPLVNLPNQKTFLETTLETALDIGEFCWISCRKDLVATFQQILAPYLEQIAFIVEPEGKNTAPAIFASAFILEKTDLPLLVLPIDHSLEGREELREVLSHILPNLQDQIVIFGHKPDYPASHYGYMECLSSKEPLFPIRRFIEKPDQTLAKELVKHPLTFWNMGMFLAKPSTFLKEGWKYCPDIMHLVQKSLSSINGNSYYLENHPWDELSSISFDKAILEKTTNSVAQILSSRWEDLGTWEGFFSMIPPDAQGNKLIGPVTTTGVSDCNIYSSLPIVIENIQGLLIVSSHKGIFIKKTKNVYIGNNG